MNDRLSRTRRKSCASCTESKIKCDRQYPCSKCSARGRECVFGGSGRKSSTSNQPIQQSLVLHNATPSGVSPAPSPLIISTPQALHPYSIPFHLQESEKIGSSSISNLDSKSVISSLHASPVTSSYLPTPNIEMARGSEHLLPVNSHLSSAYASDMFEPFFSNLFSQPAPIVPTTDFSWPESVGRRTNSPEEFPFTTITSVSAYHEAGIHPQALSGPFIASPTLLTATSDIRHTPAVDMSTLDPAAPELQHYCSKPSFSPKYKTH